MSGFFNKGVTRRELASIVGVSLVGYLPSGISAVNTDVSTQIKFIQAQTINAKGAPYYSKGDGISDDTLAILNFLFNVSNHDNLIPAGIYKISSLLDISSITIKNCVIRGISGVTTIEGDFGYAFIQFGGMENVIIEGITFNNKYVNEVQVALNAVVSSHYSTLKNVTFRNCTFKNPGANIDSLGVYLYDDTHKIGTQYVDGLIIENCIFENVGRIGCTLMNRKYFSADPFVKNLFKNVLFNKNTGRNLGLKNWYGFLLSLDGNGKNVQIDGNHVINALGIGIENTSWDIVSITNNTFDGFNRGYTPFACGSNNVYTEVGAFTKNCTIKGNITVTPSSKQSYIRTLSDSVIEGNIIETNKAYTAIEVIDSSNNVFKNNNWKNSKSTGQMAFIFVSNVGVTTGNYSVNDVYDTSASATNFAPLYFRGVNCTKNVVNRPIILKGVGGSTVAEDMSAMDNLVEMGSTSRARSLGLNYY